MIKGRTKQNLVYYYSIITGYLRTSEQGREVHPLYARLGPNRTSTEYQKKEPDG
jgi:hypothetical protein